MTVLRLLLTFTLLLLLGPDAKIWAENDPHFEILVSKNVMIPMRDGVHLATDIYRPAKDGQPVDGKFPTILERTPYNKDGGVPDSSGHIPALPPEYFVPRGYAVVLQDVRGRYKSEGHWEAIKSDPNDGFDTAKWIGAQPWSDGSIGTIGVSYGGATQHALAIAGAPFVKAMVPIDAMSDFGRYGCVTTVPSNFDSLIGYSRWETRRVQRMHLWQPLVPRKTLVP